MKTTRLLSLLLSFRYKPKGTQNDNRENFHPQYGSQRYSTLVNTAERTVRTTIKQKKLIGMSIGNEEQTSE